MKRLSDFSIGEQGVVSSISGEKALRHRLLDMGVIPGTTIQLVKRAPLGDPLQVHLRGYELTLRAKEAELIEMEGAK